MSLKLESKNRLFQEIVYHDDYTVAYTYDSDGNIVDKDIRYYNYEDQPMTRRLNANI